ncbi:hypothetical protein FXO37_27195 [Capsicum annuum]|nr:hypothetical protein FXO37_27195 [Capsicum annuum]
MWLYYDTKVKELHTFNGVCYVKEEAVEKEKGQLVTGIEFYMKEHNLSIEEVSERLSKIAENAWKDLNKEFIKPTVVLVKKVSLGITVKVLARIVSFARLIDVVARIVSFARLIDVVYKNNQDGYELSQTVHGLNLSTQQTSIEFSLGDNHRTRMVNHLLDDIRDLSENKIAKSMKRQVTMSSIRKALGVQIKHSRLKLVKSVQIRDAAIPNMFLGNTEIIKNEVKEHTPIETSSIVESTAVEEKNQRIPWRKKNQRILWRKKEPKNTTNTTSATEKRVPANVLSKNRSESESRI